MPLQAALISDGEAAASVWSYLHRLEPLEPVPASINVSVRFNDAKGNTYRGSLEAFSVSFQDLFLPVRQHILEWMRIPRPPINFPD